ncbi:N-acetylmuramoyl-L-alanine amidase [Pseudogracilibacillus sp. SO30301A]|uniref:N-acetylmuramoyl-L-alanine amidase n=1 Tax=Pseudogracilibacillus sp. SO30301A TaxID=3098291 RepID=UPI00300E39DC
MRRKIFYSMILTCFFSLVFFSVPSLSANSGQAYEVGTDNLNVRLKPDHDAEVIGKLDSGDQLIGFQEKHGWVQTYYDGKVGWVASQFLIESQQDNKQNEKTNGNAKLTIDDESVRLRAGPSTDYPIIGHTSQGDEYKVIEKDGDWFNILLDDGSDAWVAAWLTTEGTKSTKSTSSKSSKNTSNDTKASLVGYNIMLDPGHGGKDPGAFGINGVKEKNLTLAVAKSIAQKLKNEGATVLMTRSDDSYVSLEDRVKISQSYWTDAFISIHYNAFPLHTSNGISTHYYSDGADYHLARNIQTALNKHTNLNNRGVQHDDFYVLRENEDVSVLVELGFITNSNDKTIIQGENHSEAVANAITEGLINYFKD